MHMWLVTAAELCTSTPGTAGFGGTRMCKVPDSLVCREGEGHFLGLLDSLQQRWRVFGPPAGWHGCPPLWLEVARLCPPLQNTKNKTLNTTLQHILGTASQHTLVTASQNRRLGLPWTCLPLKHLSSVPQLCYLSLDKESCYACTVSNTTFCMNSTPTRSIAQSELNSCYHMAPHTTCLACLSAESTSQLDVSPHLPCV